MNINHNKIRHLKKHQKLKIRKQIVLVQSQLKSKYIRKISPVISLKVKVVGIIQMIKLGLVLKEKLHHNPALISSLRKK